MPTRRRTVGRADKNESGCGLPVPPEQHRRHAGGGRCYLTIDFGSMRRSLSLATASGSNRIPMASSQHGRDYAGSRHDHRGDEQQQWACCSMTTMNANGYQQLHDASSTYTVTYGSVPASYGAVTPSSTPGGNSEAGNAGVYAESGKPDQSHVNNTTVTVSDGQANWHVDFAFHNLVQLGNRLWIENDTDGDATTGTVIPVVNHVVTVIRAAVAWSTQRRPTPMATTP
ncbi:MAG: hypothetical protein U0350_16265 [Caldilineaceae bacterium]